MSTPKDMKGFAFNVGCKVIRAIISGQSPKLVECEVTRIDNEKIYLDNSKIPIRYPKRLLIIEQEPLYRMLKKYDLEKDD